MKKTVKVIAFLCERDRVRERERERERERDSFLSKAVETV